MSRLSLFLAVVLASASLAGEKPALRFHLDFPSKSKGAAAKPSPEKSRPVIAAPAAVAAPVVAESSDFLTAEEVQKPGSTWRATRCLSEYCNYVNAKGEVKKVSKSEGRIYLIDSAKDFADTKKAQLETTVVMLFTSEPETPAGKAAKEMLRDKYKTKTKVALYFIPRSDANNPASHDLHKQFTEKGLLKAIPSVGVLTQSNTGEWTLSGNTLLKVTARSEVELDSLTEK